MPEKKDLSGQNACGVDLRLPEDLLPTGHLNYENRLLDSSDDLTKFMTFDGSTPSAAGKKIITMSNDGTRLNDDDFVKAKSLHDERSEASTTHDDERSAKRQRRVSA